MFTRHDGTKFKLGQGLKLMEHSWLGNALCNLVEFLLLPGNAWHMKPVVWAGDYADGEPDKTYNYLDRDGETIRTHEENLYDFCNEDNKYTVTKNNKPLKRYRYILNHTTKQFVDKTKVPKDTDGWQMHPLPLLTCEGNGNGSGDFRGDSNIVGSWARHVISVDSNVPADYTELAFNLTHD